MEPNTKMATLVGINGDWNRSHLRAMFDSDTLDKIKDIPTLKKNSMVSDRSTLDGTDSGSLTIAFMYKHISSYSSRDMDNNLSNWTGIWNL